MPVSVLTQDPVSDQKHRVLGHDLQWTRFPHYRDDYRFVWRWTSSWPWTCSVIPRWGSVSSPSAMPSSEGNVFQCFKFRLGYLTHNNKRVFPNFWLFLAAMQFDHNGYRETRPPTLKGTWFCERSWNRFMWYLCFGRFFRPTSWSMFNPWIVRATWSSKNWIQSRRDVI